MKIYKGKAFTRFARKEKISDKKLCELIQRAEAGKIDADLGGGVIKQRLARDNQGKSGGYRTIVLYRQQDRAFFIYGFAKSDEENISAEDETVFRKLAVTVLNLPQEALQKQIEAGYFTEVVYDR